MKKKNAKKKQSNKTPVDPIDKLLLQLATPQFLGLFIGVILVVALK